MVLVSGTRLGPYEILALLGAGGMGEVYRARDTRLDRTVAIKVLHTHLTSNPEARQRFEREARVVSSLNHPHICGLHDIGQQDGIDFLVMEYLEGKTLAARLNTGPLPVPQALEYASQIADALATAHDAGIAHLDLKPGNAMVTERGVVKVLDFGLAQQNSKPAHAAGATTQPLVPGSGQVIGTVSYMSPEQAQGKPLDARSDIFSFGALLYEMLTRRRAFQEDSNLATLAAILNKEPVSLSELAPAVPRGLDRLIEKCLQKKRHDRWQHMADVKLILDLLRNLDSAALPAVHETRRRQFGWLTLWLAGLAGALLAVGTLHLIHGAGADTGPEATPRLVTADNGLNVFPALSKDGTLLAFASDRGKQDNLDIWLQQIGGQEPIRITSDPADETHPSFSPDGTRIAFRSERDGGGVYVVPALGGDPLLLAAGGRNPRFSPDGRLLAYWVGREGSYAAGASRVFVVESGGGQPRPVHPEMAWAMYPVWSPRNDELLVLGEKNPGESADWWVLPIEQGRPKKTGAFPQLVAQGLRRTQAGSGLDLAPLDWIDDGRSRVLVTAPLGDAASLWEIYLSANRSVSGPARRITRGPGRHVHAARAISSQFERLVFADEALNYEIWTLPLEANGTARGEIERLTDSALPQWAPSITRDGRQILFVSERFGSWALQWRDLASGRERTLLSSPVRLMSAKFAGDGTCVAYSNVQYHVFSVPSVGGTVEKLCERCGTVTGVSFDGRQIAIEPMANEDLLMFDTTEHKILTLALRPGTDSMLSGGQISADGKWIAFHSVHNPAGTAKVWIAPLDRNRPLPVSEWIAITDGKAVERDPYWGTNSDLLYFISERDGFRCIWAQRLDPTTKKPSRKAFPIWHFHSARRSLRRVGSYGYLTGLSVGGDRMVFALAQPTGSIWLEEKARAK
jgi:Tol biopolymer transport system component